MRIATPGCALVRNDGSGECCGIAGSVEDNLLFGTVKTVPYGMGECGTGKIYNPSVIFWRK